MSEPPVFLERQRFSPRLLAVILAVPLAMGAAILFSLPADATASARGAVLMSVGLPAALILAIFVGLRMTTRVGGGEIMFGFPLGMSRRVPLSDIEAVEVVRYRPLRDFGGWGLRIGRMGVMYNARGDQAVRLTLRGGRVVFVGSQRPGELAAALRRDPRGGGRP